jgi:hypothetical protein
MPRPKPVHVRAEAVALARIVGAQEAARRLGLDIRSVRGWSQAQGVTTADVIDPDMLAAAADLALARVTSEVASGKLTGSRLAVVAGILQDKVRLRDRDRPEPTPVAEPYPFVDALEAWALARYGPEADRWLGCLIHALDDLPPDDPAPADPVSWAEAAIGDAATIEAWRESHDCPHLHVAVPYSPHPLGPDLAALVAEAEAFLATGVTP